MLLAVICDTCGKLKQKDLDKAGFDKNKPDMVLLLGGTAPCDIKAVQDYPPFRNVRICGVTGCCDEEGIFDDTEIQNISLKGVNIGSCSLLGYSVPYKCVDSPVELMAANENSEIDLADADTCDIFVSHAPPYIPERKGVLKRIKGMFSKSGDIVQVSASDSEFGEIKLNADSGFTGLSLYIRDKQPKLVLCGHTDKSREFMLYNSKVRTCRFVEAVEFEL